LCLLSLVPDLNLPEHLPVVGIPLKWFELAYGSYPSISIDAMYAIFPVYITMRDVIQKELV